MQWGYTAEMLAVDIREKVLLAPYLYGFQQKAVRSVGKKSGPKAAFLRAATANYLRSATSALRTVCGIGLMAAL